MTKIDPRADSSSPVSPESRTPAETRPSTPATRGTPPAGDKPIVPARAEGLRPLDVMERGRASIFDAPKPSVPRPQTSPTATPAVERAAAPVGGKATAISVPPRLKPAVARLELMRAAMPRRVDAGALLRPALRAAQGRLAGIEGALSSARTAVSPAPRDQAGRYAAGEAGRALDGHRAWPARGGAGTSCAGCERRTRGEAAGGGARLGDGGPEQAGLAAERSWTRLGPWSEGGRRDGGRRRTCAAVARGAQALAGELSLLGGRSGVVSAAAARAAGLEAAQVAPPTAGGARRRRSASPRRTWRPLGSTFAAGQTRRRCCGTPRWWRAVAAEGVRQGG